MLTVWQELFSKHFTNINSCQYPKDSMGKALQLSVVCRRVNWGSEGREEAAKPGFKTRQILAPPQSHRPSVSPCKALDCHYLEKKDATCIGITSFLFSGIIIFKIYIPMHTYIYSYIYIYTLYILHIFNILLYYRYILYLCLYR